MIIYDIYIASQVAYAMLVNGGIVAVDCCGSRCVR